MPRRPHIMIVEAPYYAHIAARLREGATAVLARAGATWELSAVPGAYEIPAAIKLCAEASAKGTASRFDGYIALGCVIRGETTHYDHVCQECARGLQDLAVGDGICIGFGVLTVENEAQALARSTIGKRDKGGEAANACLAMVGLKHSLGLDPP